MNALKVLEGHSSSYGSQLCTSTRSWEKAFHVMSMENKKAYPSLLEFSFREVVEIFDR
jgi:hypothetical protein